MLGNALRHTSPGGTVTVSVTQRPEAVEFAVAENGEGIAPEHLSRVFERFYRVDPTRMRATGGTGIGLAIVRAIVEAHGGSVAAASVGLGRGTTFAVTMPMPDGTHDAPHPVGVMTIDPGLSSLKRVDDVRSASPPVSAAGIGRNCTSRRRAS